MGSRVLLMSLPCEARSFCRAGLSRCGTARRTDVLPPPAWTLVALSFTNICSPAVCPRDWEDEDAACPGESKMRDMLCWIWGCLRIDKETPWASISLYGPRQALVLRFFVCSTPSRRNGDDADLIGCDNERAELSSCQDAFGHTQDTLSWTLVSAGLNGVAATSLLPNSKREHRDYFSNGRHWGTITR